MAELPLERLEVQLVDVARPLAAGTYELLVLVGELDARGGWATWGALSCAGWLADVCDIEVCTAGTQVRVANLQRLCGPHNRTKEAEQAPRFNVPV